MKLLVGKFMSNKETTGERVWNENGFFGDGRSDFGMAKANYSEKTLIYINKTYLMVEKEENIVYAGPLYIRTNYS